VSAKQLYVLRHAKSSWEDPGLDDHERPLAPRGRSALKVLTAYIDEASVRPDLVLCSSSRRTRETLEGVAPTGEHVIEPELYAAGPGALLDRLQLVPEEARAVMLIGHNPGVHVLVLRLAADEADGQLAEVRRKFPTGALATLSFEGSWSELAPGSARLTAFVRPKQLSKSSRSL
jgi:phosphohistidine phosphatase